MARSPFEIIAECTDKKLLRNFMENADRQKREDVWRAAFSRLCMLAGIDYESELDRDFYRTLCAYEELLSEKNNRTTRASYTRRKLYNKGVVQCLEDWALDMKETDGFKLLVEKGMPELTGEYIVLKHRQYFSQDALSNAKRKLDKHGIVIA